MKYVASFKEQLLFEDICDLLDMAPGQQLRFLRERLIVEEVDGSVRREVELNTLAAEDGLSVCESVLQGFTTRR